MDDALTPPDRRARDRDSGDTDDFGRRGRGWMMLWVNDLRDAGVLVDGGVQSSMGSAASAGRVIPEGTRFELWGPAPESTRPALTYWVVRRLYSQTPSGNATSRMATSMAPAQHPQLLKQFASVTGLHRSASSSHSRIGWAHRHNGPWRPHRSRPLTSRGRPLAGRCSTAASDIAGGRRSTPIGRLVFRLWVTRP